jgi:hypothetical protein
MIMKKGRKKLDFPAGDVIENGEESSNQIAEKSL